MQRLLSLVLGFLARRARPVWSRPAFAGVVAAAILGALALITVTSSGAMWHGSDAASADDGGAKPGMDRAHPAPQPPLGSEDDAASTGAGPVMWATGDDGTTLIRIDLATGVATTIGGSGFSQTWPTAFTPDGTLWTITNGFFSGSSNLATFNLGTGAASNVGSPMGTSDVIVLEANAGGVLYAGGFNGGFYSVNQTTGQLSLIGNMGFFSVMDFAFDSGGTLWAIGSGNNLYTVNPGTGVGTFKTAISGAVGTVMGLAITAGDVFYLTDYVFGPSLYLLNPLTGATSQVGSGLGTTDFPHGGDIVPTATMGVDDKMTSRGKFQIIVREEFRPLMVGYPGYDGTSKLDSPDLYDPNTVVGRSPYHLDGDATDIGGASVGTAGTIISDSDFSLVPPGFEGPAGSREVHTEIRELSLTLGAIAVRAGIDAPDQPISPGEVESQDPTGSLDFPADSFFDVFVEVDLPAAASFPGGTLFNSDPLLVENTNVTILPPKVVYRHGNSSAVPLYFKSDHLPEWGAGDLFGWLTLAGHGAGFDDSPEDIAEFNQIYEDEVEPFPLPLPAKQSDPGDTDGDGCSDVRENGPDETLGGLRNWLNPHDFYDAAGPPPPFGDGSPDQIIDLPNDILGVIQHYAPLGTEPTYDVQFDRGPRLTGPVWNMTAPDGVIDLPNDILGVIQQFNHNCQ